MERYLVICAPQLGDATFERLLSREGNFFDALTKPELGVERLHPTRKDAPTFPIWIDSEGTKLLVPDQRLLTAFESPERNQGLLFLDNSAPSDLRLTSLGGLHRYARLSAGDFDLPDSIFFAPPGDVAVRTSRPRERLTGRLLRETRRSAEALSHMKLEVGRLDRPPDGWMNPIVLRLALDGEAFATLEGGLAGDTRRVLAALFEEVQVLGIVPGFTHEEDMRVRASSRALERSEGPLSAMQRLVTGGSDDRSLEPWTFVALDALGGKFVIEGHGRLRGPYQIPTYSWCPPPDAPANTRWLGRQLVSKWGLGEKLVDVPKPGVDRPNTRQVKFAVLDTPPPAELIDERSVLDTGGSILSVLPRRFDEGERELAVASAKNFIQMCASLPGFGVQHALIRFLLDFLHELETLGIPYPDDLHRPWYQFIGQDRLAASPAEMFNDVLERLASPRSSLRISLPETEDVELPIMVDLLTAVPDGAFGWYWSQIRQKPAPKRSLTLTLTTGWWNSWHACLFDDPADVSLRFQASHFELGLAILGRQALGAGPVVLERPVRMRFSTPV